MNIDGIKKTIFLRSGASVAGIVQAASVPRMRVEPGITILM